MRLAPSVVVLSLLFVAGLGARANAVCNVSACSAAPVLASCCTASTCTIDGTLTVNGPTCNFDFDGKSLTVSGTIAAQGKTIGITAKSVKVTGVVDVRGLGGAAGGSVTFTTTGTTALAFSQEGGSGASIDASSSGAAGGKIFIHADGPVSLSKGTTNASGGPAAPGGVVEITTTSGGISIQNVVSAVQAVQPPAGQRGGEITLIGPGTVTVGGTGRLTADDGSINVTVGGAASFADGSILQSNLGGSIIVTAASVQGLGELRAGGDFGLVNIEATDGPLFLQRGTSGITVGPSGGVDLSTDTTVPDGTLTMAMPILASGASVDIESAGSLVVNGKIETTGILDSGADDVTLTADEGDVTVSKGIVTSDVYNAGKIEIEATNGSVAIAATLQSKGGLDADGGDITVTAGAGDLTLQGDIQLNASGADTSGGGDIDLEAARSLTVGSSVELITDGSPDPTSDAGSIFLLAGLEGVAESLPGDLSLLGDVKANGHAASGGNQLVMTGCTVSIPSGAILDITGDPASQSFITARKMVAIGGTLRSAVANIVEFPTGTPPSLSGTIVPAVSAGSCINGTPTGSGCSRAVCTGVNVPAGCLTPCPQCGDSVTQFPETCDVGAGGPFCNGGGDYCDGQCRLRDCDDGNPCTDDSCDPATGCVHTPKANGLSCADNNVCNGVEACSNGQCVAMPGTVPTCVPDTNPCTTDGCNPQSGCFHTPVSDGPTPGCTDNNLCNGTEQCVAGTCQAGTLVTCPSGMSCNPATGLCGSVPCTSAAQCNDGNPCTDDLCPSGFCSNPAKTNGTSCDDNNVCNGVPTCQNGVCAPVLPLDCNDNNECTTDSCNPASGCQHGMVAGCCNVAGDCNDGNLCTTDSCDVATHTCQHGTTSCDDGMPCTADACDAQAGCSHTSIPNCQTCSDASTCTDDADPCTDKACIDGRCQFPLSSICCTDNADCVDADNNPCTGPATCDTGTHRCGTPPNLDAGPQPGCGTTCVPGTCQSGTCVAGTPLDCNDNDICTADVCVDGTGCTHPAVPLCCTSPTTCVDQNVCTVDDCDVDANRCTHAQPDATCSPCTGSDPFECGPRCQVACVGGRCQDSIPDCNDANPCTVDACDPVEGCTHVPQNGGGIAGCDDGQACNGAEQCVDGACQQAAMPECDDQNPCTDDSCLDASGCTHTDKTDFDAIGCRIDAMRAVVADAGSSLSAKTRKKLEKKIDGFARKLTAVRNPGLKCTKAKRQLTALARQLRAFQKMVNKGIGRRFDPSVGTPLADLAGKAAKACDDKRSGLGC